MSKYIVNMQKEYLLIDTYGNRLRPLIPHTIKTFDLFNLTRDNLIFICDYIDKNEYESSFRLMNSEDKLILQFKADHKIYIKIRKEIKERYFTTYLDMCFKDESKYINQQLLNNVRNPMKQINHHSGLLDINDYCYYLDEKLDITYQRFNKVKSKEVLSDILPEYLNTYLSILNFVEKVILFWV